MCRYNELPLLLTGERGGVDSINQIPEGQGNTQLCGVKKYYENFIHWLKKSLEGKTIQRGGVKKFKCEHNIFFLFKNH